MVWLNGIDTSAHMASYMEKGRTIAVLAGGFNHVFPKENFDLFNIILENDGLVISEYSPDIRPKSSYFLKRNRIISGLSLGVLVVEAAYRSGTSVTAKLARNQKRKVFALPHEIHDLHGVGTNSLIRKGAILTTCVEDILCEFKEFKNLLKNLQYLDNLGNLVDFENLGNLVDLESLENLNHRKNIHGILSIRNFMSNILANSTANSCFDVSNNILNVTLNTNSNKLSANSPTHFSNLSRKKLKNPEYQQIYDLITGSPKSINYICKKTSKSISEVSSILLSLEINGYIKKVAGGYLCINN